MYDMSELKASVLIINLRLVTTSTYSFSWSNNKIFIHLGVCWCKLFVIIFQLLFRTNKTENKKLSKTSQIPIRCLQRQDMLKLSARYAGPAKIGGSLQAIYSKYS